MIANSGFISLSYFSALALNIYFCLAQLVDNCFVAFCSKYDFATLPAEDDEDYIDMGGAILTFYSSLVDLLGRCAPDAETIKAGRSDSIRARAILRSLVSMEDLEGVLALRFILPVASPNAAPPQDEGKTIL